MQQPTISAYESGRKRPRRDRLVVLPREVGQPCDG
ncbi:hypothetical protein P9139_09120 [Curtobacterium flaccumfaciens]|nr:hypothetical protein P9139_09120 [Curtobacterium flaccumfaciens]